MLQPLVKDVHMKGRGGMWGIFNNSQQMTCSNEGYMLAIAREDLGRLDDMTAHEERRFWDFTFTCATNGLTDSFQRGNAASPAPASTAPCSVICAMNDGVGAWQNVGTSHCHIVWTPPQNNIGDMRTHLDSERSAHKGFNYKPLASVEIVLDPVHYADDIRQARRSLSTMFNKAAEEPSFSIYTKEAFDTDPRNGRTMVIEAWTEKHHAMFSLSQAIRFWNGLWPSPINPQSPDPGLKYSGFQKAP